MADTDTQYPAALTAQEWADGAFASDEATVSRNRPGIDGRPRLNVAVHAHPISDPDVIRALVALAAQHAGPDGGPLFTHEMVDAICNEAIEHWRHLNFPELHPESEEDREWRKRRARILDSAAAALRSLLPPREEGR